MTEDLKIVAKYLTKSSEWLDELKILTKVDPDLQIVRKLIKKIWSTNKKQVASTNISYQIIYVAEGIKNCHST